VQNPDCRFGDHLVPQALPRFHRTTRASVCMPGSPGWVGDHCFSDDDCKNGNHCAAAAGEPPGICTQACERACPDEPGFPSTFCAVGVPGLDSPTCVRQCTSASNASECPADSTCVAQQNSDGRTREVCVPTSGA
jgi:hypothetical protein